MTDTWEEMKGSQGIWLPKIGESIEGVITALTQGQFGVQAAIETKNGVMITPSHKVLQSRIAECKIGDYVKISFEKEELPSVKGRQGTKIYKVMRKAVDAVPVEKVN